MNNKFKDGILFIDEKDNNEKISFNFHTWVEMLKAIIVKYAQKSQSEAEMLVMNSHTVCSSIDNYMDVIVLCHDSEYYWAMIIAHGDQYWLNGISPHEPEGYFEWDKQYRKDHNLAEESFVFSD